MTDASYSIAVVFLENNQWCNKVNFNESYLKEELLGLVSSLTPNYLFDCRPTRSELTV